MDSTSTAHAKSKFLPAPKSARKGIALCLSGGGFRAVLFHLGALRRLNEVGILSQVDTISSVSGGSIVAAHLASALTPWPAANTVAGDWESRVAAPMRAFVARNLRTPTFFRRLLPWHWFDSATAVKGLEANYRSRLLAERRLEDLPEHPRFVLCATDMAFGTNWTFERSGIGDYEAGYVRPAPDWPLARAVAASSCFPPAFDPLPLGVDPAQLTGGAYPGGTTRDAAVRGLGLTDGGVYDNLGLEPVWKDHAIVLVSDGGAIFPFQSDAGWIWRLGRYVAIQGHQAAALRKRWLISGFLSNDLAGAYWGIGSPTSHYGPGAPPGYSAELVDQRIANIRTDVDAFSDAEGQVLENHGYLIADAAVGAHTAALVAVSAAVRVPHPSWMDEAKVRTALRDSSRKKELFGRL